MLRQLTAAILCISLLSCSTATKREEVYTPSPETIRLKSNAPIYEVFDRWDDKIGDRYLYDGKQLIAASELPSILADSPSPEATSCVRSYNTWKTIAGTVALASGLTIIVGLVGMAKKDDGSRPLSPSTTNTLLASGAALGAGAFLVYRLNENRLVDALRFHNEAVRPAPGTVTFNLEWGF